MTNTTEEIRFNEEDDQMEIDLVELFYFYRSRWIMLLSVFIIGAAIAGLVTYYLITPLYQATTKLYMVTASKDSVIDLMDLNLGTGLSADYEELIKIRPVFEEVIEKEKLPYTYEELLGMTEVSTVGDTRILNITVTSPDPKEAMTIANDLAEVAVRRLPKIMDTSAPNIAEEAILPQRKSSPSLTKNTMIGAGGALAVALAFLTFIFISDDTLKSSEEVEKVFGVMPLTVIPEGDLGDNKEEESSDKKDDKTKGGKK